MVRPSRRRFLGGSALTLATLTGVLSPETTVNGADRPSDLDVDISSPFADVFLPLPTGDALSTTYAMIIAERVDADTEADLSYRARSVADRLDIDVDELAATASITPSERGIQLVTAAGGFDRPDRGETIAVGAGDGVSSDDVPAAAETTDELPAGWRLTETDEAAFVAGEGVAAAATGGDSSSPRGRSDSSADDMSERRVEAARVAGRAAVDEVDRFAESSLGTAALPRLGGFGTVLLAPDAAGGPFPLSVPDDVDAFAAGFEADPNDLRDIDGTAENAYVVRPAGDLHGVDDETVRRLVRTIDPADPVEMDITRTDGVVLVDAVVEAPPELDREASPDAHVRAQFDRDAGTVTFEHAEGEAVPVDELEVWHDGEEVSDAVFDGEEFTAGDTIAVDTGLIATVMLRWFDPDANVYDTYAREQVDREAFALDYDMRAETLELSYEAERPADASSLRLVHRDEGGVETVGEEFTGGTLDPGDEVTVADVSIGDSVQLSFDVERPMGGGSLVHYRARPPRVWIHSHAEEGTTVRYDDEESRPADAFVTLVDGEPTDAQFADEYDTLSGDEELVLGELPLGSTVAVEWRKPDEPVVVAEHEVVPNTRASIEYDPDAGEITVQHARGRTLPASALELQVGRSPADVQPEDELDEFGPDASFTAPVRPLSRVRLVWTGGDREHHLGGTTTARDAVAAAYDDDAEAMTIEYVGEQPADPDRLRVSVNGAGDFRGEDDQESAFAAEHDELTTGDTITVDDVGLDDTVVVSVHTEFENGSATSSVAHFSGAPRHGFMVDRGGRGGDESETTLRYVGDVRRDADAFRVLIDGEPAPTQPADETDRLTDGETLSLGDPAAGATITVEWTAGDETRTVLEHVIPPEATFEVAYESADDGEGGLVTFTHAGGDALDADRVDVVVEPATDGLRPWDDDADEVTAGDETSVTIDSEPEMAVVVFNESEVLHRERLDQDE